MKKLLSLFAALCLLLAAHGQNVSELKAKAQAGDAKAQSDLGFRYHTGNGITQDYAQAVFWYRKAAEQGDAYAQANLGVCYTNGQGVAKDQSQAVYWYRKAAEQGHAGAQKNLGICYYNGQGIAKDHTLAEYWWRKAAEQGDAEAQKNLDTYFKGNDVPQSKAVEQGNAGVQKNPGLSDAQTASFHVQNAGTLHKLIRDKKAQQIAALSLSGEINGTDIILLRKMCGAEGTPADEKGILRHLDLSKVRIKKGGESYYTKPGNPFVPGMDEEKMNTQDDVLGEYMFESSQLESVILPETLQKIGGEALTNSLIKSLIIPASVKSITASSFSNCKQLVRITVAPSNPYFTSIDGILYSKDKKSLIQYPAGKRGGHRVPSETESIYGGAFDGCTITLLTFTGNIKSRNNFRGTTVDTLCVIGEVSGIHEISVTKEYIIVHYNQTYTSIDGLLYDKAKTYLYKFPRNKVGTFTFPTTLRTISPDAFMGCQTINKLSFPESLEEIKGSAFSRCTNLKTIILPSTIKKVGRTAFRYCSNLSDIYFKSPEPPVSDIRQGFLIDNKNCILHIPRGSLEAYKKVPGWGNKIFKEDVSL